MTFDIRMVGRPPVVTQFLAGGPGFLDFLEGEISPTLVVASSKPNGSVQIFEPLGDPTYAQYLQPSLSHGEVKREEIEISIVTHTPLTPPPSPHRPSPPWRSRRQPRTSRSERPTPP